MGDLVACKCVLTKHEKAADTLFLVVPPDFKPRIISCRPKGEPRREEGRPEWEYEEKEGGRLHLTPSLLAKDTGFHTDFNWSCDYIECVDGGHYDLFYSLNPELKDA